MQDQSLPLGWILARLGEVTFDNVDQSSPQAEQFTYVDISSVDNGKKMIAAPKILKRADAPSRARQGLRQGDVLVSMTRPNLNAVAIVPISLDGATGSTGFHVLRANRVLPAWIYFAVQTTSFVEAMSALVQGALYPAVRPRDVRQFTIPLPPLAEQRRIVAEIETQFARLDAAEAALVRAQANLRRFRDSTLVDVVDGPAEEVGSILETPLSNGKSVGDKADGFPVLRLTALRNGAIDTGQSKPGDWTATEAQRYLIREGDFLVARGNGSLALVGRGALVGPLQKSVAFPDTMIRIRCHRSRMIPEFLRLAWNSPGMRAQIETTARTTAGIYKIIQKDIARFRLPFPPLHVQHDMVAAANELLGAADRTEVIVNQNIAAAGFLRQSILQRAFSGQLVPQDPDDEPASVLLESITAERASAAPPRGKAARRSKATSAEVQSGFL